MKQKEPVTAPPVEEQSIYEKLEKVIMDSDITKDEKSKSIARLAKAKSQHINLLLIGPTAVGKSSTINAMFNMEKAKVGEGVDPETKKITSYTIDNLTLWDTPGLGDGAEEDRRYLKMIKDKLCEKDQNGNALIDLVLVILDASQKDIGTAYDCINSVLIPTLGEEAARKRILIALNQCDQAMKGRHWNMELNEPDLTLTTFLDQKAASIQRRIKESTGIDFMPVYYSAGYKEEGKPQQHPYNLTKLLLMIIEAIPKEKRLVLADTINRKSSVWRFNDCKDNYSTKVLAELWESVKDNATIFADHGINIGVWVLGAPGGVIGGIVGGAVGALVGAVKYLTA